MSTHDSAVFPWVRGNLSIPKRALDQIFDEATKAYERDEEACGLVAGPGGEPLVADDVVPMMNRANKLHELDPETYPRTGRMYFDIDPLKFDREVTSRAKSGSPAKILYHSHLDVGAYFSDTDAAAATMGGEGPAYPLAYLVASVRGGNGAPPAVDDAKLFIWDDGTKKFVETKLTVVEETA